jgi:hypothetical protein
MPSADPRTSPPLARPPGYQVIKVGGAGQTRMNGKQLPEGSRTGHARPPPAPFPRRDIGGTRRRPPRRGSMQLRSKRPPPERRRVRRRRTPCPDSICSNQDPSRPASTSPGAGPRSGEPTGSATRAMTAVPRGKGRSSQSAQPLRRAVSSARPAERSCCPRGSRGPGGRTGREHWALEHQHDARCVPRMAEAARMDDLLPHRARRAVGALSALLISVVASFVASNGVLPWDSMSTVCFVTCMDGLGAHGAAEVRRTRNA